MKRVAALYDIHANLPALEAVLNDVLDAGVDHIVVGGDVVPGPMPRETIACLLEIDIAVSFIQGNGEVAVLAQMSGIDPAGIPDLYRPMIRWMAQQLRPDHQRLFAGWPTTCRLDIFGLGDVLFCHATPRNENEIFTRLTSEQRLLPVFAGVNASLVVCGHTHMQFDRRIGTTRVVNAGSVGMPFERPAGAYWLLLGPDVQLRRTDYDFPAAAERIRGTTYPHAEDLAVRYILDPPPKEEMLEAFGRAELT
jgi:predicted phosphodiesterase